MTSTSIVNNSGQGQNFWLGQAADPSYWPLVDVYRRPDNAWKSIEVSPGVYDWTILDNAMAEAKARGGRLTWRIMPWYNPGAESLAPAWIPTRTLRPANGQAAFTCPDWNSPAYIQAWISMIRAMGTHADNDLRLWAIDLSGFGAWGEHYWDDAWGPSMTPENFRQIAEATRLAFPNTWVLGPAMEPGFTTIAEVYSKGGKWGTRFDFLGGMDLNFDSVPAYKDLWKRGPVVSEWGPTSNVTMAQGLKNVQDLHVSVLSSGNKPRPFAQLSSAEQQAFLQANTIAGYRLSLDRVDLPSTWTAGSTLTIKTTWTNHGVAPTYDAWRIEMLVNGRAVTLPGDLRTVLPGTTTFTHTVKAPAFGSNITLRVVDPSGYLPPMKLATSGRLANGSYPVTAQVTQSTMYTQKRALRTNN